MEKIFVSYHNLIFVTLFIVAPSFAMNQPINLSDEQNSDLQVINFIYDKNSESEIMHFADDTNDEMTQSEQTYLARQMALIKQIIQDRETRMQNMLEQTRAMIVQFNRQDKYNMQDEQTEQKGCCTLF